MNLRLVTGGLFAVWLSVSANPTPANNLECLDEAPLPAFAYATLPQFIGPSELTRFSGIWVGKWGGGRCHLLVVDIVGGSAYTIYSWGHLSNSAFSPYAHYVRRIANVEHGQLTVPLMGSTFATYARSGNTLKGKWFGERELGFNEIGSTEDRVLITSQVVMVDAVVASRQLDHSPPLPKNIEFTEAVVNVGQVNLLRIGTFTQPMRGDSPPYTLVVREVRGDKIRLFFAWGWGRIGKRVYAPGYTAERGTLKDGVLTFVPFSGYAKVSLETRDDGLQGELAFLGKNPLHPQQLTFLREGLPGIISSRP